MNRRSSRIRRLVEVLALCSSFALARETAWHVRTTTSYSFDGVLSIQSPSTNPEDLLVLFLSRTDGLLPLELWGWKRAPGTECYKSYNKQDRCWVAEDCEKRMGQFCTEFPDGNGQDLATAIFFKRADRMTPYTFFMLGSTPSWAVLTAISGLDVSNVGNGTVRDVATRSCDLRRHSSFPSVDGKEGDILLLSMAYDDGVDEDLFRAPPGTRMLGHTEGDDETGILYGMQLTEDGATGTMNTEGDGSHECKDALIALTLARAA